MLIQMVDVIFADVAQPDQARIIALNAHHFLKNGGAIVISIKANCIDSTAPAAQVFASEVNIMRKEGIKPKGGSEPYGRRLALTCHRAIDVRAIRERSRYRRRKIREAQRQLDVVIIHSLLYSHSTPGSTLLSCRTCIFSAASAGSLLMRRR